MKRPQRHPHQDYRNRDYVQHLLTDEMFDALNTGDENTLALATSGCLDAIDYFPAGSMIETTSPYYDQSFIERGVSLEQRRQFDSVIDGILAEVA